MKDFFRLCLADLTRTLLAANSRQLPRFEGSTVIVAPHADDETLGCGALLAALAAQGHPVHVVFVSDSADAGWSAAATRAERAALRHNEALAALRELGLSADHAAFLAAPDGALDRLSPEAHAATISQFSAVLARVRPARVFLPLLGEGSTEHDAAVWLAGEAIACAGIAPVVWEYPVWAWWNALRLRRQIGRQAENFRFATAAHRAAKQRALDCHLTQRPHLPAVLLRAAAASHEFYFRRPFPS